jgi:hypothetical protein
MYATFVYATFVYSTFVDTAALRLIPRYCSSTSVVGDAVGDMERRVHPNGTHSGWVNDKLGARNARLAALLQARRESFDDQVNSTEEKKRTC